MFQTAALGRQTPGNGMHYGFNFSYPIKPPCCVVGDCPMRADRTMKEKIEAAIAAKGAQKR